MRIGIAIDYGNYAKSTSLNLTVQKLFLELGKIMNKEKTFTISALKYETLGIGDINIHYDCISIPNLGGYRFPHEGALNSNNLIIGAVGIDEIILEDLVYKSKSEWLINKPIIKKEIKRWKENIERVKFLHIPTESEKEQFFKYLSVPEKKMMVIPHGVDKKQFFVPKNKKEVRKKILEEFNMKDKPYFIHLSEVNWARKNIKRMLEAFKNARKSGIEQELIFLGKMDNVIKKIGKKIPGVHILGFVSEKHLTEFLQGADGLIFPSLHEGFGLPIIEAMACGTPVITSNVFCMPEVTGKGGLYVDPYDIEDIAEKIINLGKDSKLQKELSEEGIKQAQKFEWSDAAQNLLELIQKNVNIQTKFDFKESFEISAYRTMTTIAEINEKLYRKTSQDLLEGNYDRIIEWCKNVGLHDDKYKNYLIPFEDWLYEQNT